MKIIAFLTTIFLPGTFVAVSHPFTFPSSSNINQITDSLLHALLQLERRLSLSSSEPQFLDLLVWAVWRNKKTERLRQEARASSVLGNNNYSESNFYFEKGRNGSRNSVDPGEEEEMAEKTKQAFVMPNFMKRRRENSYRRSNGKNTFKTRRQ
jgi:hypothetical protein